MPKLLRLVIWSLTTIAVTVAGGQAQDHGPRNLATETTAPAGAAWPSAARRPPVTVSVGRAAGVDELRNWDLRLDTMLRAGDLAIVSRLTDRTLPGRTHEYLAQLHAGVPVLGGGIARQLDRGVAVSLFGVVYPAIDVDPTPALSADDAIALLRRQTGTEPARGVAPLLTVLPVPTDAYVLAWRATMNNARTYFVSATDGSIVRDLDEVRSQASQADVGTGRGLLGDLKKVSVTSAADRFQAHDQLRPGEIVTLDLDGSMQRLQVLLDSGPFGIRRWTGRDVASDADNDWQDAGVVDAHVHMDWTYDYFTQQLEWGGIDGRNGRVVGLVNPPTDDGFHGFRTLNNAFFVPPPFGPEGTGALLFGGTAGRTTLAAEDVVGHEMTHGVTHYAMTGRTGEPLRNGRWVGIPGPTSIRVPAACSSSGNAFTRTCSDGLGLVGFDGRALCDDDGRYMLWADEAGAADEAWSDIFATAVEFFLHDPGDGPLEADYRIGEDTSLGTIRALDDPRSLPIANTVRHPDATRDALRFLRYSDGERATWSSCYAFINGRLHVLGYGTAGVHENSTILSHAYYLAVEGGVNRTTGRRVEGVGADDRRRIEEIFFRAVTNLLPPGANWSMVAAALRQAAVDLFGVGDPASRAIDQALDAVGLPG